MNRSKNESNEKQLMEKHLVLYKKMFFALLVLFVISSGFNIYEVFHHRSVVNDLVGNRYPFLDPMRNLLSNKDVITNVQPLRDYLENMTEREKGNADISLYFEYLNTGANISVNKDLQLWPVSLAKVPLAMVVLKKVEKGEWSLDQEFVATDENLNSGSGYLYKEGSGVKEKISKLLEVLLEDSDNTAYRIFKRETTQMERDLFVEEIGLPEFFKEDGKVSAKEYTRLFRSLYTAGYLNREYSQYMLDLLTKNTFKDFLSQGVPENIPFAHKQGENVVLNVFADSGIVFLQNRPYLISVMIQPKTIDSAGSKEYVSKIMKEISQNIHQYIISK